MENKINIAELLKNCPKGMELYSPIFGKLKFNEVNVINNRILVVQQNGYIAEFESDGRLINCKNGECLLFPSKAKRDWSTFQRPFMDGDIVVCTNENCTFTAIFKGMRNDSSFYRYGVMYDNKFRCLVNDWSDFNDSCRLATEEEKEKLFKAIKDNGYKWNPETKTLERLVEPSEGTLVQIDFTRELRIADEVEVILGDYEFVLKDGKTYFVKKKPQYPKTYEECCNILGIEDRENGYCGYEYELLGEFQKLLICRNAYWKIAGEEMGLDKPWKPDWNDTSIKYCLERDFDTINKNVSNHKGHTFAFPTAEMRDAFYDNFKDLIDSCKELL